VTARIGLRRQPGCFRRGNPEEYIWDKRYSRAEKLVIGAYGISVEIMDEEEWESRHKQP
jgi:hypothetical protein